MQINILIEKDKEGQFGRCGFQIKNKNQKHLECYIPKIKSTASHEEILNMHSIMKAMQYCKKNLKRLKFVKFVLTAMPSSENNEWKVMNEFVNRLASQINCRIEYTKA
ncbi:MAG: hypothetical protein IJ880_00115 [Bacilli bacterium]|nr:hypothetical protein [Bacilli bacterium]